jgi:hypothetical protein
MSIIIKNLLNHKIIIHKIKLVALLVTQEVGIFRYWMIILYQNLVNHHVNNIYQIKLVVNSYKSNQ